MARPLRIEYPNALYHVTSRGNAKKPIYKNSKDRELFLDTLKQAVKRFNWICHAYCLLDNHYHLLIETPDANLSKGMRQLNGVFTQSINRRHKRVGHLFQGRYNAIIVQKESHLLEVARYIVLNPVRAKAADKPEKWKWSSYRATAGTHSPHPCLTIQGILSVFGTDAKKSRRTYREFVRDGMGATSIWKNIRSQSVFGDDRFLKKLCNLVKWSENVKEISRTQRFLGRPGLSDLFLEKSRVDKRIRNRNIYNAVVLHGYSQKEVADYLGFHYSTVSCVIKKLE